MRSLRLRCGTIAACATIDASAGIVLSSDRPTIAASVARVVGGCEDAPQRLTPRQNRRQDDARRRGSHHHSPRAPFVEMPRDAGKAIGRAHRDNRRERRRVVKHRAPVSRAVREEARQREGHDQHRQRRGERQEHERREPQNRGLQLDRRRSRARAEPATDRASTPAYADVYSYAAGVVERRYDDARRSATSAATLTPMAISATTPFALDVADRHQALASSGM